MITIYHNPRCRKSREGLEVLEQSGKPYKVVHYLEEPLGEEQLKQLLRALGMPPMALIRTQEPAWKSNYRGRDLSDGELIKAMVAHPKLIERPIVVKGNKAVIGRPAENIGDLLRD